MHIKMFGKKAEMDLASAWAEVLFIFLLVLGLALALTASNVYLNFIVIFLCGLVFGRLLYQERMNLRLAFYLAVFGFLVGYVIGSYYTNKVMVILFFVVGIALSYYLHFKRIIE